MSLPASRFDRTALAENVPAETQLGGCACLRAGSGRRTRAELPACTDLGIGHQHQSPAGAEKASQPLPSAPMTPTAVTAFVQPQRRGDRIHDTFILISNVMRQEPALMPTEPLPTSLGDGAETPDSYMETLLRQA